MQYVIQIVGLAGGQPCPERGMFVQDMDFEARNGHGHLTVTDDIASAKRFSHPRDVFTFVRMQPANHPYRSTDGMPNRPMTAYNLGIIPYEDPQ